MTQKIFTILASCLIGASAFAQNSGSKDRSSDKMDLKNLEDKYWAAKDADFSVVQNRTYTKAGRFFTTFSYGPLMNDSWSVGRQTNIALGYYFSERMGVEIANESGKLTDNDATQRLVTNQGVFPNYNQYKNYTSANFILVPFYAKMSFWDRKVMYFDMQFALGAGQMTYTQKMLKTELGDRDMTTTGFNIDVSQQLFFHEHMAFRLDIKNKFTTQEEVAYQVSGNEANRSRGKKTVQDTSILLGLTIFY